MDRHFFFTCAILSLGCRPCRRSYRRPCRRPPSSAAPPPLPTIISGAQAARAPLHCRLKPIPSFRPSSTQRRRRHECCRLVRDPPQLLFLINHPVAGHGVLPAACDASWPPVDATPAPSSSLSSPRRRFPPFFKPLPVLVPPLPTAAASFPHGRQPICRLPNSSIMPPSSPMAARHPSLQLTAAKSPPAAPSLLRHPAAHCCCQASCSCYPSPPLLPSSSGRKLPCHCCLFAIRMLPGEAATVAAQSRHRYPKNHRLPCPFHPSSDPSPIPIAQSTARRPSAPPPIFSSHLPLLIAGWPLPSTQLAARPTTMVATFQGHLLH